MKRTLSGIMTSVLYVITFVCIQLFTAWIVGFIWYIASGVEAGTALDMAANPAKYDVNAPLVITQTVAYGVVTLIVFIVFKWSVVSPRYLRKRQWGVFFWSGIAALGTIIPMLGLQELMPLPDISKQTIAALINNEFGYIALCIFAPLVEELVFRGAILRTLLRTSFGRPQGYAPTTFNSICAIAVSALIFALVHVNPAQMPHAFIVGLLLGWMYTRTGSILPGVAFHWVNNTVVYVGCVLAPYMQDMTLTEIFRGSTLNAVLAVVFSLFILIPALYQLNRGMKNGE